MFIHKKSIVILVSLIVAATIWVGAATNLVDQHGVLSGRVVSQNLVAVGVFVKEGAVLANVERHHRRSAGGQGDPGWRGARSIGQTGRYCARRTSDCQNRAGR